MQPELESHALTSSVYPAAGSLHALELALGDGLCPDLAISARRVFVPIALLSRLHALALALFAGHVLVEVELSCAHRTLPS